MLKNSYQKQPGRRHWNETLTLYLPNFCRLASLTWVLQQIMKKILIFFSICGLILLLAVATILLKGAPANQRDVVKAVTIKRS
jgi:hypothetical protein